MITTDHSELVARNPLPTNRVAVFLLAFLALLLVACQGQAGAGDVEAGDQRAIQNKGSDTVVNIALAWAGRM